MDSNMPNLKRSLCLTSFLGLLAFGAFCAYRESVHANVISIANRIPVPVSQLVTSAVSSERGHYSDSDSHQTLAIHRLEPLYAADFSNDRILVGASHNIFVGRVIAQSGTKERGIGPETQFRVEIVENIKGELSGEVTVNQQGGYKDGELYVVGEDEDSDPGSYVLREGSTYLFATRYSKTEDWYTLNPHPAASALISGEVLEDAQLKELISRNERVAALGRAYPEEILIRADVVNENARNSFSQTQVEEPQASDLPQTEGDEESNLVDMPVEEAGEERTIPTEAL